MRLFLTSLKQTCNEYLIKFSENQSAPKLENRKTSPCSPCAPNLLHVLVSRIPGYHNLCSPDSGNSVNEENCKLSYQRRRNSAGRSSARRATMRTTTARVCPIRGRTIRSFRPFVSLQGPAQTQKNIFEIANKLMSNKVRRCGGYHVDHLQGSSKEQQARSSECLHRF